MLKTERTLSIQRLRERGLFHVVAPALGGVPGPNPWLRRKHSGC